MHSQCGHSASHRSSASMDDESDRETLANLSIASNARAVALPFLFRSLAVLRDWDLEYLKELHAFSDIKSLVRFTCLHTLVYDVEASYGLLLARAALFAGINWQLPASVRVLSVEANAVPVLASRTVCPSLADLSVGVWPQVASCAAWPYAPYVKRLELRDFSWEYSEHRTGIVTGESHILSYPGFWLRTLHASAILEKMPDIRSLTVGSCVYSGSIEEHLPAFKGLRKLRMLSLAGVSDLGLGCYPPTLGNAWSMTAERRDALRRDEQEAIRRVKRAARHTFPALEYLWLSGSLVYCFTSLGRDNKKALDELQPFWSAYQSEEGDAMMDAFLEMHPECGRFEISNALRAQAAAGMSMEPLKNLSLASRSARAAALPYVFRSVVLRRHWTEDRLRDLHAVTTMKPFVRIFFFGPFPDTARKRDAPPPAFDEVEQATRCAALLAAILGSFSGLRTLMWEVEAHYGTQLADAVLGVLRTAGLRLDSVRTLVVEANAVPAFVGSICPCATAVSVAPAPELETRANWPLSPQVTRLELREICWTHPVDKLALAIPSRNHLAEARLWMPNVRNLTLNHRIISESCEDYLVLYSGWRGLRVLSLDCLGYLGLGFFRSMGEDPEPMTAEQRADLDRREADARVTLKRLVRRTFPGLQYLWVGKELLYCFAGLKDDDDGLKALDELQPMWAADASGDGDTVLNTFLQAHPDYARFEYDD
ncbi:hypothetical protein AURDEDRAFT_127013 [Auricularia subglabra TFB-10046 SS5]|nr:hypothetical protein AURDEDRAFT_127013 [Auricularia subglabra TFB-10046 SS5]